MATLGPPQHGFLHPQYFRPISEEEDHREQRGPLRVAERELWQTVFQPGPQRRAGVTCSSASGAFGGGASGSAPGNGVNAAAVSTAVAGAGATAPAGGGDGGAATITTTTATSGSSPGGGGGGHNNTTGNSGAGADGQIVITDTPNLRYAPTWTPSRAGPSLVFSNTDETVTASLATTYASTRVGGAAKTSGKFYWEVSLTSGTTEAAPGIADANDTTYNNFLGSSTTSIGWFPSGNIYNNNAATGTVWAALPNGSANRVCFAL